MNTTQRHALSLRETDIQGALKRFCENEGLYSKCLADFACDSTISELNAMIAAKAWDDAFTAAHALKGLAGNMGFVPLMHALGELVVLIRGGRVKEIAESIEKVNSCHRDILDAIKVYLGNADENSQGELK